MKACDAGCEGHSKPAPAADATTAALLSLGLYTDYFRVMETRKYGKMMTVTQSSRYVEAHS